MKPAFETGLTMRILRSVVVPIFIGFLSCLTADASHLVTGNGFGFAVVAPENGTITKFYAHPYSFGHPDPGNPLSEGIETANFFKELGWGSGFPANSSANYQDDSHVIHLRSTDGEGFCFMPFGLGIRLSSSVGSPLRLRRSAPGGQCNGATPSLRRRLFRSSTTKCIW